MAVKPGSTVFVKIVNYRFHVKDSRGGPQKAEVPPNDHDEASKCYLKFQGSRKLNCPAVIQIRGIKIFSQACYEIKQSDHATENSLKMAKKKALQRLKDDMFRTTANVPTMTRYYVKLPFCSEHHGHPIGASATINHCVDRRIIRKIYDLVQKGVTRPDEVKRCLDEFVEREVFADVAPQDRPKRNSRKYYPTRQDLRNHITKAIAASKYCKDDQESLLEKVTNGRLMGPEIFSTDLKGKKTTAERSFYSSTKKFGSKGSWADMGRSSFFWMLPTRRLSMHCHYFSSVSIQTLDTKSSPNSFAKTRMLNPLPKHSMSFKAGIQNGILCFSWLTIPRLKSTPLKGNFQRQMSTSVISIEIKPGTDGFALGKVVWIRINKTFSWLCCNVWQLHATLPSMTQLWPSCGTRRSTKLTRTCVTTWRMYGCRACRDGLKHSANNKCSILSTPTMV